MRRLITTVLAVAIVGILPVAVSSSAQAIPRGICAAGAPAPCVTAEGKEPRNDKFIIKGNAGFDYAKKKITVERRDRPGSPWRKVTTTKTKANGSFNVRIFKARGSRKSCFRIVLRPLSGFDKTKVKVTCIVTL